MNANVEICILRPNLKCRRCCSFYDAMFCSKFRRPIIFNVTEHYASNIILKETKSSFSQLIIERKQCAFFSEFNLQWNAWLWLIVYLHGFTYTVFNLLFFTPVVGKEILVLFTVVLVTTATKCLRELGESLFWSFWLSSESILQFHFKSGNNISKHDRKRVFYHIGELISTRVFETRTTTGREHFAC